MCGTDTRTQFPLAAPEPSGCGCCSTGARTTPPPAAEGSVYSVEGLTCGHCVQTVEKAVASVDGVESATVELVAGGTSRLTVAGTAGADAVRDAVTGAGYSFTPGR
ncbi:heavy-metal-associated domain-containing protein [Arthrobacter sp. SO3]|uniref:heavy-metal-associated domain-containing protein n=1 Tax=Arthrobacter sp. SO3 TaxID=1897057 RepID=UPI001CFF6364|nr:heavy-metal-associated domain-containing protein [Arthrobacter sp. SO3]MCB5293356.1 Copper chaperone CopZ [Arthrobacter sp. SO3]